MADTDSPRTTRRSPRFVLLVIAVLIVLAAIFCGPTGSRIHRSSRQQRVASFIRAQGGVVRFLSESGAESGAVLDEFTRGLLGDEYFADACSLNWAPESSDELHLIESFPKLMALHLEGTVVTDAAFGHLVNLPKLSVLSIDGAVLGPDAVSSMAEVPKLRELSFQNCSLSEAGLRALAQLSSVRSITFQRCGLCKFEA